MFCARGPTMVLTCGYSLVCPYPSNCSRSELQATTRPQYTCRLILGGSCNLHRGDTCLAVERCRKNQGARNVNELTEGKQSPPRLAEQLQLQLRHSGGFLVASVARQNTMEHDEYINIPHGALQHRAVFLLGIRSPEVNSSSF